MIEKDVQKRILKAILSNGGTANTREISDLSGLKLMSVIVGGRHLISRALVRKEKPPKAFPQKPHIYHLNQKLLPKIKRLISEIGK